MSEIAIGRIVHYVLTADDARQVSLGRLTYTCATMGGSVEAATIIPGRPMGNPAREGEEYPLLVTRLWGRTKVNGQVLLDGNDALWVTSWIEGKSAGTWHWPALA